MKLRLQPIRVLVFHQVSDAFDEAIMWDCDWNGIDSFKKRILKLKKEYSFISLQNAHRHISEDYIRTKKYAVLTSDDGFVSIKNILPWLAEQKIPITLFLNPAYLAKEEVPERGERALLSLCEIQEMIQQNSPYVTVASHGWTHKFCNRMTDEEFKDNVDKSVAYLEIWPEYVPFFAYVCGKHTEAQDEYLLKKGVTPVYCDGMVNFNEERLIRRECIDEGYNA